MKKFNLNQILTDRNIINVIRLANWNYYTYLARIGLVKTRIIKGVVFIETKHSLTRW